MLARKLLMAGSAGYVTTGCDFDGTNDDAFLASTPTGLADGKMITASFWFRDDRETQTGTQYIFSAHNGTTSRFSIRFTNTVLLIVGANTSGTTIFQASKTLPPLDGLWHCVQLAIDMNSTSNRVISIDEDTTGVTWTTYTNQNLHLNTGAFYIGANVTSNRFNGCLSEIWLNDEYEPTVSKFCTGGKPIFLGADGSLPTGNQPVLYMPDGNPADNKGTGGNFSTNGTLDVSSTSPSD